MLHPAHAALLEVLKNDLAKGDLTPTDKVGPGTFVCMTQATPFGMAYNQISFEQLPPPIAEAINGQSKGFKFGDLKVVAIFDIWPSLRKKARRVPVKVFDN